VTAFRVQCETCQSWLKVRDEGFVGEVHSCPKCGSMVLIAAPTGVGAPVQAAAAAPVVAVMSNTLETAEAPPEAFAVPPPLPEPVVETVSGAAFPWVLVASISGAALAGVATIAFFLWPSAETPDPPSQPVAIQQQAIEAALTQSDAAPAPLTAATRGDSLAPLMEEVAAEDQSADTNVRDELPAEPVATEEQETPTLPPERATEVANVPEAEPVERVALANTPPVDEAPKPEEAPTEIDPLAIDFDEVEVVLRKGPASKAADIAPVDESPASTPSEASVPTLDDDPTLDNELAAVAQHAGVFVRRGPTNEVNGPFVGSSQTALTYVIPSVDLQDIPLDEAMQLVGGVAGVPITIDPMALRLAGVSARKPIDIVGEAVTLTDLLASSLKPLRLGVVAEGPYVTVVRLEAEEVRMIQHQVADLVGSDEAELANFLRCLGKLPADSQFVDGKFAVTAPLATQYDLVVLCERLRLARKLPLKTKYPPSLFSAEPSLTTLAPMLDRRTTFSFVEPTPLADVLAHWRRVTGLSILVDWRALADIGYGPRSTVECSVTNRPMRAALDGVLGGLGLTWGAIDGRTLWLTTHDAAQQPETIEFYPPGTTAPDGAVAESDPVSSSVLVRTPAIEQREIAEGLATDK
jgi:hypothetical protein